MRAKSVQVLLMISCCGIFTQECCAQTLSASRYDRAMDYLWTGLLNSPDVQFITEKGRIAIVPSNVKGQKAQMDWILLHPPKEVSTTKMSDRSVELPAVNGIDSGSGGPLSKHTELRKQFIFNKTKQLRASFSEYRTAIEHKNTEDIAAKRSVLLELVGPSAMTQADDQLKNEDDYK